MKRKIKMEDKRSNILKAAAVIFSKDGYYKAKVEEIAQIAGIGKGTIYLYFESKKQLFYYMIKEGVELFLDNLCRKTQPEDDHEKTLKTIIEFTFEFMEQHKDITTLIISHPGTVDENMQKWISDKKEEIISFIVKIIEGFADFNEFNTINPVIAAHSFLGMIASLLGEVLFRQETIDVKKISDEILQMFFYGLKNQAVEA